MSGIAGIIHFDGKPADPALIRRMTGAMSYRGPDGIQHFVRGNVALGHLMLHTTPESLEETQPLCNEDESLVLVMDGRVDNWEDLRRELLQHGARLRTRADAELVLRAYETWGENCLAHIDGDFALAIWNEKTRELFAARDRVGNKPFTYHWQGTTLTFASDICALPNVIASPFELNEGMVAEFLTGSWESVSDTFWSGILRLSAAHHLIVSANGPKLGTYWTPDLHTPLDCKSDEEYAAYYRTMLEDIVRRLSRSHEPLGCEVSGGLDSSAIFALADYLRVHGRLLAPDVDGYTLRFDWDTDANELRYCRAVAEFLNRDIREVAPTRKSVAWCEAEARRSLEFPYYPNGIMSLGLREEAYKNGSRVLLSGLGGDQWLFGNHNYYAEAIQARSWRELVNFMAADSKELGVPATLYRTVRNGCYPLLPNNLRGAIRSLVKGRRIEGLDTHEWLSPPLKRQLTARQKEPAEDRSAALRVGQREKMNTLYGALMAHSCEVEERLAAKAGIEMRRPYWCWHLAQFTLSTPNHIRQRGGVDKFCHRKAMAALLPKIVLERTDKADFSVAYNWYFNGLRDFLAEYDNLASQWVDKSKTAYLVGLLGQNRHGAWPEKLIWLLFGCLAVRNSFPDIAGDE